MATITDFKSEATSLTVTWDDGTTTTYPWIWLRDHAHDEETFHPITMQRNIHTASIPRDIAATNVKAADGELAFEWSTGDQSTVPVAFLAQFRTAATASTSLGIEPILWDAEMIKQTPTAPYDAIMNTDEGLLDWLTKVSQYGFALGHRRPGHRARRPKSCSSGWHTSGTRSSVASGSSRPT